MWIYLLAAAVAVPTPPLSAVGAPETLVTSKDVSELLDLDDYLLTISRKLANIEQTYDYIENGYTGENPDPEFTPNRPTLRDRRRALRSARAAIARTMTETWVH